MRDRDDRMMRDDDDRHEGRGDRTERFGGGQSGYGSGRSGDDRSMGPGYRNQSNRERGYNDRQGMRTDERWTGRGGEGYWEDRSERGREWGGLAQEYNQQRYPDEYGPSEYGQPGRWANVPQASMQGNYGQGMQSNYGQPQGGHGMQREGGFGRQGMREGSFGQQQGLGGFRGKGPKGYTRSDERIKEMVCEALQDDDDIDASHIELTVKNGEVTLTGTVEDRRQKRLAEECVEQLPPVRDVQNQLRVGTGNQNTGSAVGRTETETSSDKRPRA